MNYTVKEYAQAFPICGVVKSTDTILRMIKNNQLPSNHIVKNGGKQYFIEVIEKK
jgi:hypothetical protein